LPLPLLSNKNQSIVSINQSIVFLKTLTKFCSVVFLFEMIPTTFVVFVLIVLTILLKDKKVVLRSYALTK